ncbi:MAG: radical SAM protein [Acidobacteria bacterium]|nr:radical SAM protein [Acidobacteriota bacterium]
MLVGIAKLAQQSPLLEAKRQVQYFELPIGGLINRVRTGMPFQWSINPYRGCEFGCKYCYARYTHEFMGMDDPEQFEEKIYAKRSAAQVIQRELGKIPREEAIAIGTATDPYQPAERRFETTRAVLEVLARESGRRLSITTKSDLVVRDLDLLRKVARANVLHITLTVTSVDADLARLLEPRAPRPDLRLGAVRELAAAGLSVGVFANPILPLITDSEERLDALARGAAEAGARYFGGGVVFLMPCAQKVFFPFLEEHFPHLVRRYRERFERSPYLRGPYLEMIQERVRRIRRRYRLAASPVDYQPEVAGEDAQLTLF